MKKVGSNDSGEAIENNVNEDMKKEEISDELGILSLFLFVIVQKIDDVINKCIEDNKNEMNLWKCIFFF